MAISTEAQPSTLLPVDQPLPASRSSPRFSEEILLNIFSFLRPPDLFNCLLAGRRSLYAAEKALYFMSEVTYGREWERAASRAGDGPAAMRRNVFQGLCEPSPSLDWSDSSLLTRPIIPSSPPYQPSSLKIEKLQLVRRFTYYSHPPDQCDYIPLPALLPSLDTLTIISDHPYRRLDQTPAISWDSPLLSQLRPKHLRLLHIPFIERRPGVTYPLAGFGSTVERVTLHLFDCLPRGYHSSGGQVNGVDLINVDWPAGMKRLDLVFMRPDERKEVGLEPTFYDKRPAVVHGHLVKVAATSVARLIATAVGRGEAKELVIRIIGLGFDFENESHKVFSARENGIYRSRDAFSRQLEEVYRELLRKNGMKAEEAEMWVEKLELVDMGFYLREEGGRDAVRHQGIEGGDYMESHRAHKYPRSEQQT